MLEEEEKEEGRCEHFCTVVGNVSVVTTMVATKTSVLYIC